MAKDNGDCDGFSTHRNFTPRKKAERPVRHPRTEHRFDDVPRTPYDEPKQRVYNKNPFKTKPNKNPDGRITLALNLLTFNMLTSLAEQWDCSMSMAARRVLSTYVASVRDGLKNEEEFAEAEKLPLRADGWDVNVRY